MRRQALLAAIALAVCCLPAQAVTSIELRPGMPAIQAAPAPALWAGAPDADRLAPGMRMDPPHPYEWVFAPGAPVDVAVACDAPGRRLLLTVWDWRNTPVAQRTLPSPAHETVRLAVAGRGTYLLTLDQMDGDKCVARLARSFSVCPSNQALQSGWRAAEFVPGCCAFPGRQNWGNDYGRAHPKDLSAEASAARDAELSARLGLALVRPDLPGSWPAAEKPIDFAATDVALKCWTDRGFRLALQIGFPDTVDWTLMPQYRGVTDPKWRYPRTEQVARQFAEAAARRYGKDAAFIEIYNEPDNADFWRGTVQEFIDTHRWMAEGARKGAPGVPIITGGICLMDPERTGQIVRGVRGQVDGVGYHSHGGVDVLEHALTAMRAIHAAAGYEKPAFTNTEMGYANWRLDMERMSAATAIGKLLYCWVHGNKAALLYASRETGWPRGAGDWGYLDYTFCPRFTYGAIAAFCDLYAGAKRNAVLVELNGLYAYRFRKGQQMLVPIFTAQDGPRSVRIETDAKSAALVDAMGNSTAIAIEAGRIALTTDVYPQTLVLEAATKADVR